MRHLHLCIGFAPAQRVPLLVVRLAMPTADCTQCNCGSFKKPLIEAQLAAKAEAEAQRAAEEEAERLAAGCVRALWPMGSREGGSGGGGRQGRGLCRELG